MFLAAFRSRLITRPHFALTHSNVSSTKVSRTVPHSEQVRDVYASIQSMYMKPGTRLAFRFDAAENGSLNSCVYAHARACMCVCNSAYGNACATSSTSWILSEGVAMDWKEKTHSRSGHGRNEAGFISVISTWYRRNEAGRLRHGIVEKKPASFRFLSCLAHF
jgi:hypothetical protein